MAAKVMKALQLTKAQTASRPELGLSTIDIPTLRTGELLVKIRASGIQPSDRLNVQGSFPTTIFPRVPGRDFSGVVVDGPPERVGEEVFGTSGSVLGFNKDGAQAQFCAVPELLAVKKPKTLSFIQAAAIPVPFSTAMICLKRARATTNDTVLVLGATGQVGSAAVQIAKAMGCKRVLAASRGDKTDVNTSSDPNLTVVQTLTDGKGVDVVVDTVGSLDLMAAAVDQLALRGRYAWISAPRGGASTALSIDTAKAYRKQIELVGCNSAGVTTSEVNEYLTALRDMFESGSITTKEDGAYQTLSLDEAKEEYLNPRAKNAVVIME